MRKFAYLIAAIAMLAGCSGHGSSTPRSGPAVQSGSHAVKSLGGSGTTTMTYYDQYAPTGGPCNASGLTIVNGTIAASNISFAAGQGPQLVLSNCGGFTTSQYVSVALGTPQYGHPYIRQDGYATTIDAYAPAKVTATWTALGSSLPGTPGATGTVTVTIGSPVDFTMLWQTGSGTTGQYVLPAASDGQCAGVGPTINGDKATFTVLRNTNGSYTDDSGHTTPHTSTCWRNQMNPLDPNTNDNYQFTMGQHYSFFFQTVVTLNGNTFYGAAADGNYAVDIPAIVWQTHSWGENPGTGPCDILAIGNTQQAANIGFPLYQNVPPGGQPTWTFHTCSDPDGYSGHAYNSPDTLYDGEIDNWQIEIDAEYDTHGGHVTAYRNGSPVYDTTAGICDSAAVGCWWNFGPYMFYWETTEEPSGFNNAGVTVKVKGMTLTTPAGGGQTLSRKRNT
jgi:hypothetical protein